MVYEQARRHGTTKKRFLDVGIILRNFLACNRTCRLAATGRIACIIGFMIILSVGMPRAGSGWYYNLTNDMMLAAGAQDARQIRGRFHLQRVLTEVNCNIGTLCAARLSAVMIPSLLGNSFVIKAHGAPSSTAMRLIQAGQIRSTYIYRDPRDAMLSAMENGRRAIERNRPNAFSPYVEFANALDFIEEYLHIGQKWMDVKQALTVRYENLLINYDLETNRLAAFLELDPQQEKMRAVIERYRPEKAQQETKGIHFSHGRIGRFRQKMDHDQQQAMLDRLSPYLTRLGYAL